jgi:peptide/nickel transport system substrate-binding protein
LIYGFAFYQAGSIVCDAGLTAQDADFAVRSYGSGPYVIESVKPQEQIVLKRRPEWSWGPLGASANDPGFPETLTFLPVTNETTAANLLITGGLDLTSVVGPDIKRLRQDGSFIEMSLSGAVTNGMGFNMGPSHVTSNIAVRRAISAAVDPKAYALAAYDGEAEVVRGYYAPTHPCYDPNAASLLPTPPGDLDKARAILLADGYSLAGDGKLQKNGKPLAIALIASSSTGNGPEYVTEQLNKMGATATLNLTSDDQHRANLFGGSYDVFFRPDNANLSPSGAVGLTPNFHPPLAPTGRDFFYLDDPVLTGLFEKAGADPTCNGWKEWQRRVLTQAYYMPLVVAKVVFFGRRATYTEGSTGFGPVAASIRQRP